MTREEFLAHAGAEIAAAFNGRMNRMKNLVEQAWAEGKRNAEVDAAKELIEAALDRIQSRGAQPFQIGGVINVDLTKGGASDDADYPTWEQWLCEYYQTFATYGALQQRIPADIAVKLGYGVPTNAVYPAWIDWLSSVGLCERDGDGNKSRRQSRESE